MQKDGTQKTRPIVSSTRGIGTSLGELLSDLISPLSRTREDQRECQSTEEMVVHIQSANKKLDEKKIEAAMFGSMDVEVLYPSIDQKEGARIVGEELMESPLEFQDADMRKAAVYLAVVLDKGRQQDEKVQHLLPSRKARGNKEGIPQ